MEKWTEIPEMRLQSRRVEEVIPEPWIHEIDGRPPTRQGMMSATAAKQRAIDKLKLARSKLPKFYNKETVFDKGLLEILPLGTRHGLL